MKLSNITERITNRAFPWFCVALFAVIHSACNNEQINEGRLPEDTYPLRFSATPLPKRIEHGRGRQLWQLMV